MFKPDQHFSVPKNNFPFLIDQHNSGSVFVIPNHTLKASILLLTHAMIQVLTICDKNIMRH